MPSVLVTVGSTKFDDLVQAILTAECLTALSKRGYTDIIVQYGNSRWDGRVRDLKGLRLHDFSFKPSLSGDIDAADLVISHAGSGTILDTLRRSKRLIVVPNSSLMDDHQSELAHALAAENYLLTCRVDELALTIENSESSVLGPFPKFDGSRFRDILDEEMGFI